MKLKKILAASAACALLVGALAIPASAHGGCHGRRANTSTTTTAYPVCTVADCALNYRHEHDGVTYCGHTYGDGHTQCAAGTGLGHGRCR